MKYLLKPTLSILITLALASSCTAPTPSTKKTTAAAPITAPTTAHKMARYFQDSKATNSSSTIVQLIEKAQQDPNNTEPLYSLGYVHMQSGINTKNTHELELAEIYLKEVLTQFPGNQAVLQALYNVYYDNTLRNRNANANSFESAKAIFVQLSDAAHETMNPPSLAKFAATAAQQDKDRQLNHQALRDILLQAIQESPKTDTPYIHLAKLYSDDHYFALAIATLKLGEENIQSSVDLYKAIADTYIKRAEVNGCNYEHASDIQSAGKYYQLAIPLKPDDQALHYALSQAFLDQNRNQLGLSEAQIALDIKSSKETIGLKAQTLSTLGYHTQALTLLQNSVGQGYSPSDVGYHEIYMDQGDWAKAAEGFNAYVKTLEKFSVYDLIKGDMIAQQAQVQPWAISKKVFINNSWEQALFNYWGARMSADDLKKQAHTSCEKTEYFFYTGYKDLQAGQTAQANSKFTAAINQNTYRFIERPLARYFLQKN